ncbi:MAG: VOC family protein [Planctomycetota bacterium]
MIVRIVPPAICVSDVQAAENFFRSVLEFDVRERRELPDGEGVMTCLASPRSRAEIKLLCASRLQDSEDEDQPPAPPEIEETKRITAWSDDFTADVDRFLANGAELLDPAAFTTSRTTYASFVGPEGYIVELIAHRTVPRPDGN